ncbi:MAG: hypothetical protein ACYDAG_02115 [Chloroflexota bacterium]
MARILNREVTSVELVFAALAGHTISYTGQEVADLVAEALRGSSMS